MFLVFKLFLGIILLVNCCVYADPAFGNNNSNNNINLRMQVSNLNDTALEIENNCKCVIYFECDQLNKYMFIRARFRKPKTCSDDNYICCRYDKSSRNLDATTTSTSTTTRKPETSVTTTSTTTEITEGGLRMKNVEIPIKCGVPKTVLNGRILTPETDSETTIPGEVPWMVSIFQKPDNNKYPYRFKCAGSLIHPKVVLTATHCVKASKKESLRVVATGLEVFQNIGAQPASERTVLKIIKHREYYSGALHNDIALLILQEPYDCAKYSINFICLPKTNQNFDGKKCLAVGWGGNRNLSSVPLMKVDVPIVDSEQCQNLLRKTHLGSEFELHSSFLCAGGEAGKDTCNGDGGSPLMCLGEDYRFVQVGIVSWGVNCGVVNEPGLYANVAKFREWIDRKLEENQILLTQ